MTSFFAIQSLINISISWRTLTDCSVICVGVSSFVTQSIEKEKYSYYKVSKGEIQRYDKNIVIEFSVLKIIDTENSDLYNQCQKWGLNYFFRKNICYFFKGT